MKNKKIALKKKVIRNEWNILNSKHRRANAFFQDIIFWPWFEIIIILKWINRMWSSYQWNSLKRNFTNVHQNEEGQRIWFCINVPVIYQYHQKLSYDFQKTVRTLGSWVLMICSECQCISAWNSLLSV